MSTGRRKIILDTDPGVGIPGTDADDPIALLLALTDARLELLGVTTVFGNCPPELGARGAAAVLAAVGREDIPVVPGAAAPLDGRLDPGLRTAYDGVRGREGRIPLPDPVTTPDIDAATFIARTVLAHPGEVTVVAVGPQTNLAAAIRSEPRVATALGGVVFMGGALGLEPRFGRGNVTPVAECNIYYDAEAADIVFRSGVPLTMVSLDVTNPTTGLVLTRDRIRAIDRTESDAAELLAEVVETYLTAPMFDITDGCVLYDPLAVLAAADPSVGSFEDLAVAVELLGQYTRGQTVTLGNAAPNLRAMTAVDGAAAVESILNTILTAAPTGRTH